MLVLGVKLPKKIGHLAFQGVGKGIVLLTMGVSMSNFAEVIFLVDRKDGKNDRFMTESLQDE